MNEQDIYEFDQPIFTTPNVDKAIYMANKVIGFYKEEPVVEFGGVTDINAIELYNDSGERIIPEPAEPDTHHTEQERIEFIEALMDGAGIQPGESPDRIRNIARDIGETMAMDMLERNPTKGGGTKELQP